MPLPAPSERSTALVTGASSGIGADIARELAARGHGVSLVARRRERLAELAAELADRHSIRAEVFACDLADGAARAELAAGIEAAGLTVSTLVNNAGFGGHGDFVETEEGWDVRMVRLNVEAVTDLLATHLPAMVDRGEGAVVNIASTAAFQPMPGSATYAATKAFVLSQGEALHQELKGTGVTATTVCPGPVKTEFAEVAGIGELAETAPELAWMTPDQIAKAAIEGVEKGSRVVVPGRFNRAGGLAGRHLPRALVLPALERAWNR
ncbi:MAG TPA: SDR family oxidoreductase [Solirubrobacterales bacterium]|nr:SDR family oxidoreductase [Solirubrobacterales bacterium]